MTLPDVSDASETPLVVIPERTAFDHWQADETAVSMCLAGDAYDVYGQTCVLHQCSVVKHTSTMFGPLHLYSLVIQLEICLLFVLKYHVALQELILLAYSC